jgi:hypothetical protein
MKVRRRFAAFSLLAAALLLFLAGCGTDGDELRRDLSGEHIPAPGEGGDYVIGSPENEFQDSDQEAGPGPGTTPPGGATAGAKGAAGVTAAVGVAAWDGQIPVRSRTVMLSAPATLNQADTEYILTQDIVAPGTAFTITATNVTLNLNGRTVTYANSASSGPVYGVNVTAHGLRNVAIVNGTIRQGNSATATDATRRGWHGINIGPDVPDLKIAGMKIEYRTPETFGINVPWGRDGKIHHNDLHDTGSFIINRHQLIAAIKANRAPRMEIHHNRIVRARQAGIDAGPGAVVHNNEINIDSHSTNSYGVVLYDVDGFTVYNNTIKGAGEHPIGIGMVAGSRNGKVYGNRVEVQNTRGSTEYGSTGSAGMRMTWGTDKVEIWNNHITVRAQANLIGPGLDSWGRGLWLGLPDAGASVLFRDNTIIARNSDGRAKAAAIAIVCGNRSSGLVFRNNMVVSNWANVLLTDDYGDSQGFPRFVANTFRKEDNHSNYTTIRSQYASRISTGNFFSSTFENGAALSSLGMEFHGSGLKEIGFGWSLRLTVRDAQNRTLNGVSVRIVDNSGAQVFSGSTDADGRVVTELVEYQASNRSSYSVAGQLTKDAFGLYGNRIRKNPYTITVEGNGTRISRVVEITGDMEVGIDL